MTSRTISICQGKGSIGHNNRAFHTKNTDPARTKNNIVFVREHIGTAYDKLFAEVVERYNAKQKRSDRKIKSGYFEYQFGQQKSTTTLEMLDMVLDKFKSRIAENDRELEESRSVIAKLKEQLSFIKQEFVKVVLAVNTLVYSDKYCRGLSGLSKALATGISFFTDNTFKKLGEYDSINKCAIDDEIRENMSHFIEPEKSRTSSHYER